MTAPVPTVIRASALSGWTDCPRRGAARLFGFQIKQAGYKLRSMPRGVAAAIGSAVHAGAAAALKAKLVDGALPPVTYTVDAAIANAQEAVREGVAWDDDHASGNDVERQVTRMTRAYHARIAPDIEPIAVEERLEAQVAPGIILSGQSDVLARERNRVRDLKTGKMRGNNKPQLGAYSLLARSHRIDVREAAEDFIPRASLRRPQEEPTTITHDIVAAETAAWAVIRHIAQSLKTFTEGDEEQSIKPGDPWSFAANPSSRLCSPKWCAAYGSDWCREHKDAIQ